MKLELDKVVKEVDALSERLFLMDINTKRTNRINLGLLHEAVNDAKSIVAHLETMEHKLSQGGDVMKNLKLLIAFIAFTVTWDLKFIPDSGNPRTEFRIVEGLSRKDAINMIRRAPKEGEIFECQNSHTGEHGYCAIEGMDIKKTSNGAGGL